MTSSTQQALKIFTSSTLREARAADLRGDLRMATLLRLSVSDVMAQHRRAPASAPISPEMAKKREVTRAWAQPILTGLH